MDGEWLRQLGVANCYPLFGIAIAKGVAVLQPSLEAILEQLKATVCYA